MSNGIFIELLKKANPQTLDYIVKNNQSIVFFCLNKVPLYMIQCYIHLFGGKQELERLNAHDIRNVLRKNRPDLLKIIEQRPGWLEREIDRAKDYLGKL